MKWLLLWGKLKKKKKSQVWKSEEDLRPESPAYGYVSLKKLLKFRSPGQDGHKF